MAEHSWHALCRNLHVHRVGDRLHERRDVEEKEERKERERDNANIASLSLSVGIGIPRPDPQRVKALIEKGRVGKA